MAIVSNAAGLGLAMLVMAGPCSAQDRSDAPPKPPAVLNDQQLFHNYLVSTFGVPGAVNATLAGSFDHWQNEPSEWATGPSAYAKRWASSFARQAIGSTTEYTVSRVLHQDPSFTRCQCTGLLPRVRHALLSPFTARTHRGRTVLSPAIVAGLAAEGIVPAATWYPAHHGTLGGIGGAAVAVGAKMGVDVLREFVPCHGERLCRQWAGLEVK